MNSFFSRIYTFFHTRQFLGDMLVRYSAQNHAVEDENERLRKKLGQKDKVLQRALDDHAQSNKFHQAVITSMQKRIDELKEFNNPTTLESIDAVCLECPGSDADCVSCMVRKLADMISTRNLGPETEQDYIDQVIQRQADEAPIS